MANYRDSKTHEEFLIVKNSTRFRDGKIIYCDGKGDQLINPKTGNLLEPMPHDGSDVEAPAVMSDTSTRWARNARHFKKRANDHDNSDEVQQRRKAREKEELTNYTGIKHE